MMLPREIKLLNGSSIQVQNGIAIGCKIIEDVISKYGSIPWYKGRNKS